MLSFSYSHAPKIAERITVVFVGLNAREAFRAFLNKLLAAESIESRVCISMLYVRVVERAQLCKRSIVAANANSIL